MERPGAIGVSAGLPAQRLRRPGTLTESPELRIPHSSHARSLDACTRACTHHRTRTHRHTTQARTRRQAGRQAGTHARTDDTVHGLCSVQGKQFREAIQRSSAIVCWTRAHPHTDARAHTQATRYTDFAVYRGSSAILYWGSFQRVSGETPPPVFSRADIERWPLQS